MAYRLTNGVYKDPVTICDTEDLLSLLLYIGVHPEEKYSIVPNIRAQHIVEFPKRGSRSEFIKIYGPEIYEHLRISVLLVEKLNRAGYTLTDINLYKREMPVFNFKGNGIEFGFSLPGYEESPYLNGKIAVDRIDYFDKYSKCPVFIPLPSTEEEFQYALGILRSYKHFDYDNAPLTVRYPRGLHKKSRTYLC